ncbi:MAG: hypothetical protein HJJLKODD_02625 [Phycisphaerae bacterium]|nr:hypothetical protein [Phycisphaerae bacterium]
MAIPLRKQTNDGSIYCRPNSVEEALEVLLKLSPQEVARRSCIEDCEHPEYVPSECMLHFLRHAELAGSEDVLCDLFVVLRQRILKAVPVRKKHVFGSSKTGANSVDLEIRDAVLDKFQEMICADRIKYDERLDFYECRFNRAIDKLRATARKTAWHEAYRYVSVDSANESNDPSEEVELALKAMKSPMYAEEVDFLYRSKLRAAIISLPPDERRVIELYYVDDMSIESNDGETSTIVKILGCTEKTVRNRRDRALQKLRDALGEEDA